MFLCSLRTLRYCVDVFLSCYLFISFACGFVVWCIFVGSFGRTPQHLLHASENLNLSNHSRSSDGALVSACGARRLTLVSGEGVRPACGCLAPVVSLVLVLRCGRGLLRLNQVRAGASRYGLHVAAEEFRPPHRDVSFVSAESATPPHRDVSSVSAELDTDKLLAAGWRRGVAFRCCLPYC